MNRRRLVTLLCSLVVTVSAVVGGALMLFSDKPDGTTVQAASSGALYTNGVYSLPAYPSVSLNYTLGFDDSNEWKCVYVDYSLNRATFMRVTPLQAAYATILPNFSQSWGANTDSANGSYAQQRAAGWLGGRPGYSHNYGYRSTVSKIGGVDDTSYNHTAVNGGGNVRSVLSGITPALGTAIRGQIIPGNNTDGAPCNREFPVGAPAVSATYSSSSYEDGPKKGRYTMYKSEAHSYDVTTGTVTIDSALYSDDLIWLPSIDIINIWKGANSSLALPIQNEAWLRGTSAVYLVQEPTAFCYMNGVAQGHSPLEAEAVYPCVTMKLPEYKYEITLEAHINEGLNNGSDIAVQNTSTIYLTKYNAVNNDDSKMYPSSALNSTAYADGAIPNITCPTLAGYSFGGYYTGQNATGTQVISGSGVLNADGGGDWARYNGVILYADWTRLDWTLDGRSAAGTNSKQEKTGGYVTAQNDTPGWNSGAVGGGRYLYSLTVFPNPGYYIYSISGGDMDTGYTINGNGSVGPFNFYAGTGAGKLSVTFLPTVINPGTLVSDKGTGDTDTNCGTIVVTPTSDDTPKGTGKTPPHIVTINPSDGFHIVGVVATPGGELGTSTTAKPNYMGSYTTDNKNNNDESTIGNYYPTFTSPTAVTVTFRRNELTIVAKGDDGTVGVSYAGRGKWTITATPNQGYYLSNMAATTIETTQPATEDGKVLAGTVLPSGVVVSQTGIDVTDTDKATTHVVTKTYIPNVDNTVITVEFAPNGMGTVTENTISDTAGTTAAGAAGLYMWAANGQDPLENEGDGVSAGLSLYQLTVTPAYGYRVSKIALTGSATSDIKPGAGITNGVDPGNVLAQADIITVLYDSTYSAGSIYFAGLGNIAGEVKVSIRPDRNGATLTIFYAKNIVDVDEVLSMTDDGGHSVAVGTNLTDSSLTGVGVGQKANITLLNESGGNNLNGHTDSGWYTAVIMPPAGYHITDISLSDAATGLSVSDSAIDDAIFVSAINNSDLVGTTVGGYSQTQGAIKVNFYSSVHMAQLNVKIKRTEILMWGSGGSLLNEDSDTNDDSNGYLTSTISAYDIGDGITTIPTTVKNKAEAGKPAVRYEYLRGYVYVRVATHHGYSNLQRYYIYVEPKPGYRVGSINMQSATVGWGDVERGGIIDASGTEMKPPSSYESKPGDLITPYEDYLIPSKDGKLLKVVFLHNYASIETVKFAGYRGDVGGAIDAGSARTDNSHNLVNIVDIEKNPIGTAVMVWNGAIDKQWYELTINPRKGYYLFDASVSGSPGSLKAVINNDFANGIQGDGYGNGSGKTETVNIILRPNINLAEVSVTFRASHASLDKASPLMNNIQLDHGYLELTTPLQQQGEGTGELHAVGIMGAPFYRVTAIPDNGYHLERFYVVVDNMDDIPCDVAVNMDAKRYDAFDPGYTDGHHNYYDFTATYNAMRITAVFKKNVIAVQDLNGEDSGEIYSYNIPGNDMLNKQEELTHGMITWSSKQSNSTITLTVTPDNGWRIGDLGIKYTAYVTGTDERYGEPGTYKYGAEAFSSPGAGENPRAFSSDYSFDNGFYVRSISFANGDYTESSDKITVEFVPMWNNGVISVDFVWNTIGSPTYRKDGTHTDFAAPISNTGTLVYSNEQGTVNVDTLTEGQVGKNNTFSDKYTKNYQRITIRPKNGYRIGSIAMWKTEKDGETVKVSSDSKGNVIFAEGVYLNTPALSSNIAGVDRLDTIDASRFAGYSHTVIFYVRPRWNNAQINVEFLVNTASVAAVDEDNASFNKSDSSFKFAPESTFGTITMGNIIDSDEKYGGRSYEVTATPNPGYKFAGWAVYLTDKTADGKVKEFNWDDYDDNNKPVDYAADDYQNIIREGAFPVNFESGVDWTVLNGIKNSEWNVGSTAYKDIILQMGKFRSADNSQGSFYPQFVYRKVNDLDSYGGHVAYSYETAVNGAWQVTEGDYNYTHDGENAGFLYIDNYEVNNTGYKSDRTLPQTVYFTPQYNGLTLVAIFEILTPQILTEADNAYPIFNGEEQELLKPALTQSWAEVQYGYEWADDGYENSPVQGNEIDWTAWVDEFGSSGSAMVPTRTNVVYMQEDLTIDTETPTPYGYVNGNKVLHSDIVANTGDSKVIDETIYYRAIHLSHTGGDDPRRPTLFETLKVDDLNGEVYDDHYGDPTVEYWLSHAPTMKVDDVRILPLPISLFFEEGWAGVTEDVTQERLLNAHVENNIMEGINYAAAVEYGKVGGEWIDMTNSPDSMEKIINTPYTTVPEVGAHGNLYNDKGIKDNALIAMHTNMDNSQIRESGYSVMQDWLNERVLTGTGADSHKMPEIYDTNVNTYTRGWDARPQTAVFTSLVEWNQGIYDAYSNAVGEALRQGGHDITDIEWQSFVENHLLSATSPAIVMYGPFVTTGKWTDYENNMPVNEKVARGNYRATGNFVGYLHRVNSFIISDRTVSVKWRNLQSAPILEDNAPEGMFHVSTMQIGDDIDNVLSGPDAALPPVFTKKYEYTFLGWSKMKQDWDAIGGTAVVVGARGEGKYSIKESDASDAVEIGSGTYLSNADWGWASHPGREDNPATEEDESIENTQHTYGAKDRETVYYAIYARKMREYNITFKYNVVNSSGTGFMTAGVNEKITKYYGERFYEDEAYNIEYKDGEQILTPKWDVPTDINAGGRRQIFMRWWDIPDSYWKTDSTDPSGRRYFVIEHSWAFYAIYKDYVMIHGGS